MRVKVRTKKTNLMLLLASISFSFCVADDWPLFRRTSSCEASIQWDNPNQISITEWHFKREKIKDRKYSKEIPVWTSPALSIVNGIPLAFAGACDQTLYALNLADKKIQWMKITNGNIMDSPIVANFAGKTCVIFTSSDRTVYCCEAYTGMVVWTIELHPASNTISGAELSSPAFSEGKIYVNSFIFDKSLPRNQQRGELLTLDAKTGKILSKILVSNGPLGPPIIFQDKTKKKLVFCAKKGLIRCFSIEEEFPQQIWTYQMPNEVLGAPSILSDDLGTYIFIGSKYGTLLALDAENGSERWKFMAGNWIDNTVCAGLVDGEKIVFTGSHDYNVYAINALTGELLWRTTIGGEIFSSPVLFKLNNKSSLAVAALNKHIYILDAKNGSVINSYFTGNPIWDKINKGDTLWGSPSIIEADTESAIAFGSTSGDFYVFPLVKECSMRSKAKSGASIWISLAISAILTLFLIFIVTRTK